MFVALIRKNTIHKINLPKAINGSYWINNEHEQKIINIEGISGNWKIHSNNNVKIIDTKEIKNKEGNLNKLQIENHILDSVVLKEYTIQYVYLNNTNEIGILYCAPILENYAHFDIKNSSDIIIGNAVNSDIRYKIALVKNKHARIFYSNGILLLENFDNDYGTFVNGNPVTSKRTVLFNGDIIFVMGLKIIIVGKNLFVNNPFGQVNYNKEKFSLHKEKRKVSNIGEEDELDIELYSEDDYFSKSPRIINLIEREKIRIDSPPQIQPKEGMPLVYVLGSSMAMGMISMITMFSAVSGIANGTTTVKDSALSLAISAAMMVSMILLPIMNVRYEKKQKIKYEEKRQKRYREYINSKIKNINEIMNKQRNILFENYLSADECAKIILTQSPKLWQRKIEDADFLKIRVGLGNVPLEIDVEYPEEQFTMDDDQLVDILYTITEQSQTLVNVPVTVPFAEKKIVALITQNDEIIVEKFIQNLIVQLITFYSYEDVKLVFLLKDSKKKYEYLKMLPHVWNNSKQIRFFANDYNDMQEISRYLVKELNYRLDVEDDVNYKAFMPYYFIITDDYKKIENLKIIEDISKTKTNMGFSVFCITDNLSELPKECKTFITLDGKEGNLFDNEISSKNQKTFTFDDTNILFFEKISKLLSNIPIRYKGSKEMALPNNYTFLEMYDTGRIEGLNILERWNENDSCVSIQAPIGIDAAGMPIVLDIHEKAHGPHGLIAGSTGSGKSEFIITYILSLAINYHPNDVAFILIDYKGGGLSGAFEKGDYKLPHIVGTITNIDTIGLQRSLASIQSELRRRQIIFNEARNKTDEGTIDIYKYQKLYHDGVVNKPIPHLIIVCDEFAELKQQQDEFMDELISVARIGRSLGVHLILATQKPAGVVDDQIRSNSKFGICLKVQEKEDSQDVIKRPDAAFLRKAGQFYMQVGNNEYFTLGKAAWAGAPYYPSEIIKKKIDSSIEIISNIGKIVKQVDNKKVEKNKEQGEQLTNIVKYICYLAQKENIKPEPLWLENIPETIFVENIRKKYNLRKTRNIINPVIGEFDDPNNQRQGVVHLNLSKDGNTIIFGNAESGKETLLSTLVYDLVTNYTSNEMQLYLLDFGSESLKIFKKSPQVGDVVFINESEKISRFFEMIQKEISKRTSILSDYGGDYNLYISTEKNPMPMNIVIINNYEVFLENYEDKYEDVFLSLTRDGLKCGIVFIITTSSSSNVRYRLLQNFKQKIALQLNNEDDYYNIFDGIRNKRPAEIFGRGLVKLEDIYEFQTAKICDAKNWNTHITEIVRRLQESKLPKAKQIPILPDKVEITDMQLYLKNRTQIPIGIEKKTLEVFSYNFTKNLLNIIVSKNIDMSVEFISNLIEEIKILNDLKVTVLDAERILQISKNDLIYNYKKFIFDLDNDSEKNIYKFCVIIGVDKLINDLEQGENEFLEMLKKAERNNNCNFMILETATKIKNREYDEWYRTYNQSDTGIWIGKGVDNQYLININSDRREIENNCDKTFAHIIRDGEATVVKLVGMDNQGD